MPDRSTSMIVAALQQRSGQGEDFSRHRQQPQHARHRRSHGIDPRRDFGQRAARQARARRRRQAHLLDRSGNSALHYAAERGNVEVLRLMLDAKAPPDTPNKQGITPLMTAAGRGQARHRRACCWPRGASVDKQDFTGRDALSWARGPPAERRSLRSCARPARNDPLSRCAGAARGGGRRRRAGCRRTRRREDAADEDQRGAGDPGRLHLGADGRQRAAQDQRWSGQLTR